MKEKLCLLRCIVCIYACDCASVLRIHSVNYMQCLQPPHKQQMGAVKKKRKGGGGLLHAIDIVYAVLYCFLGSYFPFPFKPSL